MTALLWAASAASASGFLQVGTGQRILDLPTAPLTHGGGLRVGVDAGVVVPFGGVTITAPRVTAEADDLELSGPSWSAIAGARFDLSDEAGPAQPFVAGGVSIGRQVGTIRFTDFDESAALSLATGPGAFVGAGADAFLNERVALGLEVGGALTSGTLAAVYTYEDGSEDREEYDVFGVWTYADLHLVFRFGGAR